MNIQIKRFCENDAEAVAYIINQDLLYSDIKSYFKKEKVLFTDLCAKEKVLSIGRFAHMYVAYLDDKPVGCGLISNRCEKEDLVLLISFVLPEHQGQGFGKQMIKALEEDTYYLGAGQIEIPLTLNASDFFTKIGYEKWEKEIEEKQRITA